MGRRGKERGARGSDVLSDYCASMGGSGLDLDCHMG